MIDPFIAFILIYAVFICAIFICYLLAGRKDQKLSYEEKVRNERIYCLYDKCRTLVVCANNKFRDAKDEHGKIIYKSSQNIEKLLCLIVLGNMYKVELGHVFPEDDEYFEPLESKLQKAQNLLKGMIDDYGEIYEAPN